MSERRSHWDIDLVDGVGRRLIPRYRSIGYCTDAERHRIYTLIEFVEDWQRDRGTLGVVYERAEKAEAQVQRVRELLEPYVPCPSHDDDCDSVICALRLALGLPLDGDA